MGGQQSNQQQPAAPYGADSLNVHDNRLRFAKEYGTNITNDVGEAFTTTAAPSNDPVAVVDARFGMLTLNQNFPGDAEEAPRGRTYLMPEWDTFTEQPELGAGITAALIYGHLLILEGDADGTANIILAPETMVGNQPAEPFMLAQLYDTGDPLGSDVFISSWLDGQTQDQESPMNADATHRAVYFRLLAISDNATFTDVEAQWSVDGITWSNFGASGVGSDFVARRIGLAITNTALVALDWLRIYDFPAIVEFEGVFIPELAGGVGIPPTGSRQYIP